MDTLEFEPYINEYFDLSLCDHYLYCLWNSWRCCWSPGWQSSYADGHDIYLANSSWLHFIFVFFFYLYVSINVTWMRNMLIGTMTSKWEATNTHTRTHTRTNTLTHFQIEVNEKSMQINQSQLIIWFVVVVVFVVAAAATNVSYAFVPKIDSNNRSLSNIYVW